jgi:phosphatidylglycerol---prolipoprotein diacylglyceryl transferase
MLTHPQFDPVAVHLGPMAIRWYGLMYVLAFVMFWLLGKYRIRTQPQQGFDEKQLEDMLFYGVLGVVLGGRLGYVLFYKLSYYLANPIDIFKVWQGGMSFHGGFLGVLIAMWWFSRKSKKHWLQVTDFIAPLVPLGYAAGRAGNFINGELPGRITTVPWGMWFPQVDAVATARHPSQLYQLALDGVMLFIVLWLFSRKPKPMGAVSGLFLIGYGTFRIITEFAREPDDFLGFLALGLSMGQWLSVPMIIAGIAMMLWAYNGAAAKTISQK